MKSPCSSVSGALGRPESALSEAERTALDAHLAECADCRALHAMSRELARLGAVSLPELGEAARQRAIASALAGGARSRRNNRKPWSALLVAVAAAAAILLVVRVAGTPVSRWVESARGETVSFAHARVTLSPGARVHFDAEHTVLELARGELDVHVDPRPHAPFAVVTRSLRVEVLGTQFRVAEREVLVREGRVRVLSRSGEQLAELTRGERFPRAVQAAAQAAAPAPADPSARAPEPSTPAAPEPGTASTRKRESADAVLARARTELAADHLREARGLLARAEQLASSPSQQAEAGTLRAELALRERDIDAAIRAYLDVATHHPHLRNGENALFAAAQLSQRERPAQARSLFERYLQRYPRGQFAAQARARLQASSP